MPRVETRVGGVEIILTMTIDDQCDGWEFGDEGGRALYNALSGRPRVGRHLWAGTCLMGSPYEPWMSHMEGWRTLELLPTEEK